jgi:hypothetical protein
MNKNVKMVANKNDNSIGLDEYPIVFLMKERSETDAKNKSENPQFARD